MSRYNATEGQSGSLALETEPSVAMWLLSLPDLLHRTQAGSCHQSLPNEAGTQLAIA